MHYRVFETWRLVAVVVVMVYHFLHYGTPEHVRMSTYVYRLLPFMDMFFMVSGYLLFERYAGQILQPGKTSQFWIRRFARTYPLHLVTMAFFVFIGLAVLWGLISPQEPERYDFSMIWQNLFLVQAWGTTPHLSFNYVAWCLSAEWLCYLLFPLIAMTYRGFGPLGLLITTLSIIAVLEMLVARNIMPFDSWFQADTWGAYRALADFTIGGLIFSLVERYSPRLRSHIPGWLLIIAAGTGMFLSWPAYVTVLLIALATFCIAAAERNNPQGSTWLLPLSPLGQVSFGIYLIHPVMETIFLSAIWRRALGSPQVFPFELYLILPIALTLILALLSSRHFERPVGKLIASRFESLRSSQTSQPIGT